ncbi:type I glyceraldehyde-3-phosphate dehydrogenase [archaeon]|nr:type I glyceraldehyde-3-phosphate dehydrogenase [archaeon]
MTNYAINGFGRIGRVLLRVGYKDLKFTAINSPAEPETQAHLLKYDSVYGEFPEKVDYTKDSLIIGRQEIKLTRERKPEEIPWKKAGVDVVAECTGIFKDRKSAAKHLKAGAKRVVISAPSKDSDLTVIKGVNDSELDPKKHKVINNASCTSNCFAPVAKLINDEIGIKDGFMVTAHGYTASQNLLDGSHKDLRRARAAAVNIIPTTSGASISVTDAIPSLKGKIHSSAVRVPVIDGSIIYFIFTVKNKTTAEEVNKLFKKAAEKSYKGVIQYSNEPLVSTDVIGNSHSAVFDSLLTEVSGNLVKVGAWYDNEWGYCCRMVDILKKFKNKL